MTEQERLANPLAADEAQRHAQNGEPRTVSALNPELLRNEGRTDMSLQDGLKTLRRRRSHTGALQPAVPEPVRLARSVTTPHRKP